jgi:predicted outer membrane repeat protein
MKLQRVSFSRNVTTGAGGAIRAQGTELLTTQTVFADNQASARGGAVALENTTPLHAVIEFELELIAEEAREGVHDDNGEGRRLHERSRRSSPGRPAGDRR